MNWATYNPANNQVSSSSTATGGFVYDRSGNILNDGLNNYWYDAEGRLCAVYQTGGSVYTYLYDAEGRRVAKGTLSAVPPGGVASANMVTNGSCGANTSATPGFNLLSRYLLDLDGNQVTELNSAGNWLHSNLWVGGRILATYDQSGIHFPLTDPLGTKRVQANASGTADLTCISLPFGNGPGCSGENATEHRFTGKERDAESGLDYFGARYYASSMGRMMSPDWSAKATPVPYAKLGDPQSLNLYSYVRNNPLSRTDPTGHYVINCGSGVKNCSGQQDAFNKAVAAALKSKDQSVVSAAKAYGALGEKNGVSVSIVNVVDPKNSNVTGNTGSAAGTGGIQGTPDGKGFMQATQVNIQAGLSANQLSDTTVHEGQHVADRENFITALGVDQSGQLVQGLNITHSMSEVNAYGVENGNRGQRGEDPRDINDILAHPPYSNDPNINKPLFPDFPSPYVPPQ